MHPAWRGVGAAELLLLSPLSLSFSIQYLHDASRFANVLVLQLERGTGTRHNPKP